MLLSFIKASSYVECTASQSVQWCHFKSKNSIYNCFVGSGYGCQDSVRHFVISTSGTTQGMGLGGL